MPPSEVNRFCVRSGFARPCQLKRTSEADSQARGQGADLRSDRSANRSDHRLDSRANEDLLPHPERRKDCSGCLGSRYQACELQAVRAQRSSALG